ncbi:unnamed protein product [Aphanomyces euteiches]|uniref:Uncharacterized protein n=1 Tax=Aphanomyces euteiches TaxID=100861 RepID=A0A6G0WIH3_9STRA|nr:hypothetical protein Ae201684_014879 [Aphanomyces euteiches]KAH9072615.1 hypothetical protein Ae201684P_015690 [Aphanomyces euteiches]KAH9139457.1 hypothetical protein AeRB84_016266 [Aphanomyces euteiches]
MAKSTYNSEYYTKNKTKVLLLQKAYRERNKEHFKTWYQQNKARVLARVTQYNQLHKEKRAANERERRRRRKNLLGIAAVPSQMALAYILN